MAKPPHGTQTAASKTVTADASLPTPRTPVGVEQASFRDGILLPFFLGGEKIREKTDKLCSFSVCGKQVAPYSVLSKASFFPTAITHL